MLIAQSSGEAGAFNLVLIVVIFGGLFLFMSLRQRKRLRERNAFLETLAVGDLVRTYGGVIATIESLTEDEVRWSRRVIHPSRPDLPERSLGDIQERRHPCPSL